MGLRVLDGASDAEDRLVRDPVDVTLGVEEAACWPLGDAVSELACDGVANTCGTWEGAAVELLVAEAVAVADALPCTRTSEKSVSVGARASVMGLAASAGKGRGAAPPAASRLPTPEKELESILYRERAVDQGRVALYCCRLAPAVASAPALRLRASTSGAAAPAL